MKQYIILAAFALALTGCSKEIEVEKLNFDVSAAKTNGQVKSTYTTADSLKFTFTGNPDVITFYPGELGKQYRYKDRTSADGTPVLQFTTLRANGTQTNSLALMISSDFKGVVLKTGTTERDTLKTNANIASATWDDITSRVTALSTGTAVASGNINLADYAAKGKPVYIAFKYLATAGTIQNKWTITLLTLTNTLADASVYTIANLAAPTTAITNYSNTSYSPGWAVTYDETKNANKYAWAYTAGTSLVITGATTAAAATAPAEAWAVMGPVDLKKVTPDMGIPIKSITLKLDNYPYIYPGITYSNPVFVASNNTVDQSQAVVKQLDFKVTLP